MRVLHIVGASKYGGGFSVVFSLCRMASEKGIEPFVLTSDPAGQEECHKRGIKTVGFQGIGRAIIPWRDLGDARRLTIYLAQERFEIVHSHTSKGGMVGRYAARRARVPAIFHTVHGFAAHEFSSFLAKGVVASLERRAAHWCDLVLVMNSYDEEFARRICPAGRVVHVPNGISIARLAPFQSALRETLLKEAEIPPSALVIGNICRLSPQKNLEQFLQSIAQLPAAAGSPVFGLIVGVGESMALLQSLADRLGVSKRVVFLGFRQDAVRWLAAMDVFLTTSRWEGMSISLLEAMAAGRAIVATRIKGNADCIEDGKEGLLVPVGDVAATAKACQALLESPEYASSLGRRANQAFMADHTEEIFIQRVWERAYLPVLREKRLCQ